MLVKIRKDGSPVERITEATFAAEYMAQHPGERFRLRPHDANTNPFPRVAELLRGMHDCVLIHVGDFVMARKRGTPQEEMHEMLAYSGAPVGSLYDPAKAANIRERGRRDACDGLLPNSCKLDGWERAAWFEGFCEVAGNFPQHGAVVLRFGEAPEKYQKLSPFGGDEDLVVLSWDGDLGTAVAESLKTSKLEQVATKNPWVWITAHA